MKIKSYLQTHFLEHYHSMTLNIFMKTLLLCIFLSYGLHLNAQQNKQLKVGDKTPALEIVQWFNGEPVLTFKEDQVYVVEFSGTWCPPCRKAIPHLTELTKAYQGKVKIISVYLENNDKDNPADLGYINRVETLMKAMGNRMDFTIAVDVPQQTTNTNWNITGVPSAFVIQSSKISWIGHPIDLEPVLEAITNGTFDPQRTAKVQEEFNHYFDKLQKFKQNGAYKKAVAGIDSLMKVYPYKTWLPYQKFEFLAGDDDKTAYKWLEWILDNDIKGFDWPHFVGSEFRKIAKENRNYEIELRALDKTIEDSETEYLKAYPFMLKASTYEKMGNLSKAVVTMQKAIEKASGPMANDGEAERYEKQLVIYQFKDKANDNVKNANKWLLTAIANKDMNIDTGMINAVLEAPVPNEAFALKLTNKALKEAKDEPGKIAFIGKKADIYLAKGNTKKAIKYCEQALAMSRALERDYLIKRYEGKLAELKADHDE